MAKKQAKAMLPGMLADLAVAGSVAAIAYGCALVMPALGWIVGGVLVLVLALKVAARV